MLYEKEEKDAVMALKNLEKFLNEKVGNLELEKKKSGQKHSQQHTQNHKQYSKTLQALKNYVQLQNEIIDKTPSDSATNKERRDFLKFLTKEQSFSKESDEKKNPLEQMATLSENLDAEITKLLALAGQDAEAEAIINNLKTSETSKKLKDIKAKYYQINNSMNKITSTQDKRKMEDLSFAVAAVSVIAASVAFTAVGAVAVAGMLIMMPAMVAAPPLALLGFAISFGTLTAGTATAAGVGLLTSALVAPDGLSACIDYYTNKNKVTNEEKNLIDNIKSWVSSKENINIKND